MSKVLNGLSAFLAVTAVGLFVVASVGYADDRASLKSAAWVVMRQQGTAYFGLRKAYFDFSANNFRSIITYSKQSDCPDNWCDTCNLAGDAAFPLILVSLITSFIVALLNGLLIISPNFYLQATNSAFAFISALFSIIAVGYFMSVCYDSIELTTDDVAVDDAAHELKWGNGAITAIVAMLLMWFVTAFQVLATSLTPITPTALENNETAGSERL